MSTAPLPPLSFSEIVRNFSPGWFASVMGSGVLSLTTLALAARWPILEALAWSLHYFNLLLFSALGVPWLARWVIHPRAALATLQHPVQASFYPTFSIAMLVIAAQFMAFGSQTNLALWFWWPGTALTFTLGFAVLYAMFNGEHVGLEHVTPAKFIPAVGLVVIPIPGGPLIGHLTGGVRDLALLVNVVALGAGTLMYLGLLAMTLQRKYLAKPAFGILTPTVWIHLAPSWGHSGQPPQSGRAVADRELGRASGLPGVEWVGIACWGLLLILWLVTLTGTVRGVQSGAVFRPHP
jgi:C4-dicarboxylate transporter/malic acid transport protein